MPLQENNNQVFSSKIIIKQIKEIQTTKNKKIIKKNQRLLSQMKNEGLLK